jgi:DNA polymerase-3 subunit gamma/tau
MLDCSQVVDSGNGTVTLGVAPSLARRLSEDRNVSAIAAAITSLIGGTWRVTVQPGESKNVRPPTPAAAGRGPANPPPPPEPDPRDDEDYQPADRAGAASPVDPEAEALKLLTSELGARPIERP